MTHQETKVQERHRRACWERWRYQVQRQRRRATGDPAMSVFLQLLAIILVAVARAPRFPAWLAFRQPSPRCAHSRVDWYAQQQEREHGKGGQHLLPTRRRADRGQYGRYRASPSYRKLVRDVRRPNPLARAEALDVLRHRLELPEGAHGWLEEIVLEEDWSALAVCAPPGRPDADAEMALLTAALDWLRAKRPEDDGGGGGSPPAPALRFDGGSGEDGGPPRPGG